MQVCSIEGNRGVDGRGVVVARTNIILPVSIQLGSRVSLDWIGEGTLARFYIEVNEVGAMLKEPHTVG